MKPQTTNAMLWAISVFVTLAIVVYQRATGPTYPIRSSVKIAEETISFKLPRSHGGALDCVVKIVSKNQTIAGKIQWKRYKTDDPWREIDMKRSGDELSAGLPHQPPAGKLQYRVSLNGTSLTGETPVIIRFKGAVPLGFLAPHVVLMFAGMLLGVRAALEGLALNRRTRFFAWATTVSLFFGGMVFGPVVQHYAFGHFWTGFPFGHDLTDNKTLFIMIAWGLALWKCHRSDDPRWWVISMSLLTLAIYLIPHSLLGSELDYSKLPVK